MLAPALRCAVLISDDIVVQRVESSQCSPAKIYWTFVVHAGSHFHDCAVHVSWTFREFVSPKLHRPDFARYPIIGRWVSSRAAIAIDYAEFFSRSHDAVILVFDQAGNVIETHEHAGDFKEW